MNERTMTVLCLATTIIGIIVMFIANKLLEPQQLTISEISASQNYVKINGVITSISSTRNGTTFIKVKDNTGSIDVVVFKNTLQVDTLKTSMSVEVIGRPQKYKEKMELLPSSIRPN